MKYQMPTTTQHLNTLISTAIKSAKSMRDSVQIAAVAILFHSYKHGDWTKANELVHGLGYGVKRDSLVEFFVLYGGLTIDLELNEFNGWQGAQWVRDNIEKAKATMWYDLKKGASPFQGYCLQDELLKVMKRRNAMIKKVEGMTEEDKALVKLDVNQDTIDALLTMTNFEIIEVDEDLVESALQEGDELRKESPLSVEQEIGSELDRVA